MRKIDQKLQNAIKANKPFSSGNTAFISNDNECKILLHGNVIAKRSLNVLKLDNCGYATNVTHARLNAVLQAFNYRNVKVIGKGWNTLFIDTNTNTVIAKNELSLNI
mgnify:CR=1 FL=1